MPDSKDKTQYRQTKTLTNSLRLKSPNNVKSRQNVSNILNRLPYLRTLNEAQNQLIKVTPIWQQWCSKQSSDDIINSASPASIDGKTLTISCKQSSTATILKHSHHSLLKALNEKGFEQIQNIRIQMSLNSNILANNRASNNNHSQDRRPIANTSIISSRKPSAASLKAIESTQSLVKSEVLSASLKRLAETLKKAK